MDFDLNDTEHELRGGIRALLARHAGAERAREIRQGSGYDHDLEEALRDASYFEMMADPDAGTMPAIMMVEDVSAALGAVPVGAFGVLLPALGLESVPGPLAVLARDRGGPVRYAASPGHALVIDGEDVSLHEVTSVERVDSLWGYPFGRPVLGARVAAVAGQGPRARAWWQVAVAAEIVGSVSAALDLTVEHLRERVQFGRPLGTFQALQHRLSKLRIGLEGSRWLTYRAAWEGAPEEAALTAATYTVGAGRNAVRELHQLSGAIGLTDEYNLQLWTTRIGGMCAELGGTSTTAMALSATRWPA